MSTLAQTLAAAEDLSADLPLPIAKSVEARAAADAPQRIGGFSIVDPLLADDRLRQARAHRERAVAQFQKDKDQIRAELAAIGISEIIAVVPTAYWKCLCERHGLLTVAPGVRGRVTVSTKKPYDLTQAASRSWHQASNFVGALTFFGAGLFFAIQFISQTFWPAETVRALAVIATAAALSILLHKAGTLLGRRAVRRYLESTPYDALVRELVNSGYEYAFSPSVELMLPDPPLSVVMLLRKLRDANHAFSVTAEPAAIRFNPSVEELYLRGHEMESERMRKEAQWLADPIVTAERNSVTAVLAQFGDFQWEKSVIEEIVSTVPLPYSHA